MCTIHKESENYNNNSLSINKKWSNLCINYNYLMTSIEQQMSIELVTIIV